MSSTLFESVTYGIDSEDELPIATRRNRRPLRTAIIAGVTTLALAVGGVVAYASGNKTVEIDVDGATYITHTRTNSVEQLLDEQGIDLSEHDSLTPDADAAVTNGLVVTVRTASELRIDLDGITTGVHVTALTAEEALEALALRGVNGSIVAEPSGRGRAASRSAERAALPTRQDPSIVLPLTSSAPVAVLADGSASVVGANTDVGTALDAADVVLGGQDRVLVQDVNKAPLSAEDLASALAAGVGVVVRVQRIVTAESATESPVAFTTENRTDASVYSGQSKVIQAGSNGVRTVVEAVTTIDGIEASRTVVSDEITTQPVTRIVVKGTKPRPAPSGNTGGNGGANLGSAPSGTIWAALAQCESGGRANAVSASGRYHGLYQFSVATWQAMGGSGLPSKASAAEQTQRAQALQARSGWGQWPACAKKLGLI